MTAFDWQRILLNDAPWIFLFEIALRVIFGYVLVFAFLKLSGRRGIRQLSLFELVVILTLGSSAGDVVLYEDVPILFVLVVFATILALYRATTYALQSSHRLGSFIEGKPVTLIQDGLYELDTFKRLNITDDEFFMELRQQSVEHLGQVRLGILEVDGNLSLLFYEASATRPGLSILPPEHRKAYREAPCQGTYACACCGFTTDLSVRETRRCPRCHNELWCEALTTKRQA